MSKGGTTGRAISPSSTTVITAKAHTYLELMVCTPDTPRPATIHLVDNPVWYEK